MIKEMDIKPEKASEIFKNIGIFFFFFVLPFATLFLIYYIIWYMSERFMVGG